VAQALQLDHVQPLAGITAKILSVGPRPGARAPATKKPPSREGGFSNWLRGPATTETDIRCWSPF